MHHLEERLELKQNSPLPFSVNSEFGSRKMRRGKPFSKRRMNACFLNATATNQFHSVCFPLDSVHFVLQRSVLPATLDKIQIPLLCKHRSIGLFHPPETHQGSGEPEFRKVGFFPQRSFMCVYLYDSNTPFSWEFTFQEKKKSDHDPPKLISLIPGKAKIKRCILYPQRLH